MQPFEIGRLTRLDLGYVGETGSREIQIDMSEWLERWPDGKIAVDVLKPGRKEYYLADTTVEDGILTWTVTYTDVAKAGRGMAQISIYDFGSGKVYKSRCVETIIRESADMAEDLEAPHPMDTWVARAVEAKEGALGAALSAAQSASVAKAAETVVVEARDRAEAAAAAAENSETIAANASANATEKAAEASASAEAAERYASDAEAANDEVQGKASEVRDNADRAEAAAEGLETAVTEAEKAKNTATEQAQIAKTAAQNASVAVNNATTAAKAAADYAVAAQNASGAAENAAGAALNAMGAAGNAMTQAQESAEAAAESERNAKAASAEAKEAAAEADAARAGIQGDLDAIEAKINNVVQEIGGVNLFDVTADVTSGFVMSSGISTVGSHANYTTSDYILLDAGTYTVCFSQASTLVSRFPVGVYSYPSKTQTGYLYNNAQVKTYTFELEEKAYIRFSSYTPAYTMLVRGTDIPAVYTEYTTPELVLNEDIGIRRVDALESQIASILPKVESLLPEVEKLREQSGLYGKKWAALGDSFTAYTDTTFEAGVYAGAYKTYPRIIAEKNAMDLVSVFFESGRTLAYPADGSFKNSITCPTAACYYKNIPEDVDYITIYLGINDSHHASGSSGADGEDVTGSIPLGTINDTVTSTHYGAWNVVLTWLMENRPFAHIGIIVSNGCDTQEYRTAQIAIARKYGIPYIDLNGDDRTPAMIRSQNPAIASAVKTIIDKKQSVDYDGTVTGSMNRHPNGAAHEYESGFIAEWLKTL